MIDYGSPILIDDLIWNRKRPFRLTIIIFTFFMFILFFSNHFNLIQAQSDADIMYMIIISVLILGLFMEYLGQGKFIIYENGIRYSIKWIKYISKEHIIIINIYEKESENFYNLEIITDFSKQFSISNRISNKPRFQYSELPLSTIIDALRKGRYPIKTVKEEAMG